jgi:cardiolipin synthase
MMPQQQANFGKSKRRGVLRRWLQGGLVTVLSGCQVMPAQIATCRRADKAGPRPVIAFRQVLCDSVQETLRHPLRTLGAAITEPALITREAGTGLIYKHLGPHLWPAPGPISACRPTLDVDALEEELSRLTGHELQPAAISLLTDGNEALAALEQALDRATCQIDVVMYLWDNDPLGWEVAKRIAARASSTVQVRVLIDGGGNLLQGEPKTAKAGEVNTVVCWLAQQPNVRVIRTRNPFLRFDHRKLVLIDGRLVWSGGRNFTEEAFFRAHDLSYLLTGPLTRELASRYEEYWREQGGPPGAPALPAMQVAEPNTQARLVHTNPQERTLARSAYIAIDHAKHHIYVENPDFTDNRFFAKLVQARRRGVDVRVVITLQSGSRLIDLANRVTVNRLLQAGIRVYLYPGMTHVKAMTVDGVWAYLGTGNFDPQSMMHNRELGVAISHGALVTELEIRLFEVDLNPEWEVHQPLPWVPGEFAVEVLASLFL